MKLFTIGFTQKSAERFFTLLKQPGLRQLVDVRLNRTSQLAGFAKGEDLAFFARSLCGLDYRHLPLLAPTKAMLDLFRSNGDWSAYEQAFLALMEERGVMGSLTREALDGACLLCSEDGPEQCHRRLLAEIMQRHWGGVEIIHLR